jgi:hypothetical protein
MAKAQHPIQASREARGHDVLIYSGTAAPRFSLNSESQQMELHFSTTFLSRSEFHWMRVPVLSLRSAEFSYENKSRLRNNLRLSSAHADDARLEHPLFARIGHR